MTTSYNIDADEDRHGAAGVDYIWVRPAATLTGVFHIARIAGRPVLPPYVSWPTTPFLDTVTLCDEPLTGVWTRRRSLFLNEQVCGACTAERWQGARHGR